MNLKEAASRLGVHYQAAYRHVRSGRLPAVKLAGGYEIDEEAIARFVADDRAWQRTLHPDGRLRRRRTDDPDLAAEELAAALPGPGSDPGPGLVLVARSLAAVLGDSVVVQVDGEPEVLEHANPRRYLLLRGPGSELHLRAARIAVARARLEGTQRIPLALQRDVCHLPGADEREVLHEIGVHSLLVAPVRADDCTLGVVVCSRDRPGRPYTEDDVRTIERYADLVTRALLARETGGDRVVRRAS